MKLELATIVTAERRHAGEVAKWIEYELSRVRSSGASHESFRRPYVQNTELIIKALRAYAEKAVEREPS